VLPIPPELLTMGFGAVTGFIFKFMAERAKDKAEEFKMLVQRNDIVEKSRKDASEREPGANGRWVRRVIVLSVLFGVILAPFILAVIGKGTIVEIELQKRSFLFGLFGGGTEKKFVELSSYLLIPEVRQSLMAIIGYYFGSSTAQRQ